MLAENLKYLRKKHQISQQQLADTLQIPRTTLGDYERGHTEPNVHTIIAISEYFQVDLDGLLTQKLWHEDLEIVRQKDFKVLAISVDSQNRQNIELVGARAQAGYLECFQDPEYIQELPKLYFPSIPEGTYRAFEIQGESMLPLSAGSVVICSYIESLEHLKSEKTYVIATHLDGVVYKRILKNPDGLSLTAISDNPTFPPYRIAYRDIAEIWSYYAHISFSDVKQSMDDAIHDKLSDIQQKVTYIQEQIDSN